MSSPGLADNVSGFTALGVLLGGVVTSVLLFVLVVRVDEDFRFGSMLRWVLALTGFAWIIMFAIAGSMPPPAVALATGVYVAQGVIAPYLVVELAHDRGLTICTVTASCLAFMSAGFIVAGILQTAIGMCVALDSIYAVDMAVCSLMVFAVIPLLPGRKSNAGFLGLAGYLEDEGVLERYEHAKSAVATQCGLTPRELEVMDCLLEGLTRDEVAARLNISPWTVKGYISKIYGKTGVRSARALMTMVVERQE